MTKSSLFAIIFAFSFAALPLIAEDWTTTNGKTYKAVIVVKVEDDAVTILDSDGGARVSLSVLPSNLQTRFHYDPEKAKLAAAKYDAEQKEADAQFAQAVATQASQRQMAESNTQATRIPVDPSTGVQGPTFTGVVYSTYRAPGAQGNASTPSSLATELGRYKAKVQRAVGSRWYTSLSSNNSLISPGFVDIRYTIHSDGTVDAQVVKDTSGGGAMLLRDLSLNAILNSAPFDPFTDSMRRQVGESFTDDFTFTSK